MPVYVLSCRFRLKLDGMNQLGHGSAEVPVDGLALHPERFGDVGDRHCVSSGARQCGERSSVLGLDLLLPAVQRYHAVDPSGYVLARWAVSRLRHALSVPVFCSHLTHPLRRS